MVGGGPPPATPSVLRGRDIARAWEGWGKRIGFVPSDISARASTPLDERRRYFAMQKFSSGSNTTHALLKTRRGCARADSEGTRRSPKLGGGFLPPPKQMPARAREPAGDTGEEMQAT